MHPGSSVFHFLEWGRDSASRLARHPRLKNVNEYSKEPCRFFGRALLAGEGERRQHDKLLFSGFAELTIDN